MNRRALLLGAIAAPAALNPVAMLIGGVVLERTPVYYPVEDYVWTPNLDQLNWATRDLNSIVRDMTEKTDLDEIDLDEIAETKIDGFIPGQTN